MEKALQIAKMAVTAAGPEDMHKIMDAAVTELRARIEKLEMLVLRDRNFTEPIPIVLPGDRTRESDLERHTQWLHNARSRLVWALQIKNLFSQMSAERSAMEIIQFIVEKKK